MFEHLSQSANHRYRQRFFEKRTTLAKTDQFRYREADLRELTWHNCGIVRTGQELQNAIRRLDRLGAVPAQSPSRAGYELRNLHTVAQVIARCALARQESRGGHYRSDFPQPKPEFRYHSSITKDSTNVSFR